MKYLMIAVLLSVGLYSCSDFLDKKPITVPVSEGFFDGYYPIVDYINGLYNSLPDLPKFGMGSRGKDKNSDNILAKVYDKRLNGELHQFDGASEWEKGYQNLRDVNYFFRYFDPDAVVLTPEIQSLEGEAYFLRAYWHFYLLKRFGSIPVMDTLWDKNATLEGLQIPATGRTDVVKFILNDLSKAKNLLFLREKYKGLRISKEAAMIFAMRVALYEGTWQKYQKGTVFAAEDNESEFFLNEVMRWGDSLFQLHTLHLNQGDANGALTGDDAYGSLFNSKDLSAVPEAVFWKKYNKEEGVFHALSGLLGTGVVDNSGPAGVSLSLINSYLNEDGTFIDPANPKFKDFNDMFVGRDHRLNATIMHSHTRFKSAESGAEMMLVKPYTEANKDSINPPHLLGYGQQKNLTGFHIRLGINEDYVSGNGETADIFIRYAEALLDYAEAAEELGKCTDAVLEKTIKPLRERAGVTYIKPTQIDPNFPDFGYPLTANMQEIRRERRVELALQGYRLDDLMRWRGHLLFQNKTGRGAYLGTDGVLYQSFSDEARDELNDLITDDNGWLNPMKEFLSQGYQFEEDRDYLLPIPPDVLILDKKLEQNPNWK